MEQSRTWWQERSRVFLSECARLVTGRLGEEAVEAVFVCGSLASGDESVVLETRPAILLSDIDLVVVVRALEDLRSGARRRAELGAACEALWNEVRFSGRVDIGVVLPADLERMPARPGVLDMRARGAVLSGNRGILERIPPYTPRDIPVREAVILMENRGTALLDGQARQGGGSVDEPYASLYRIARAYTDIAAAALSIDGSYVTGYAARRDLLRALAREKPQGALATFARPELLERIDRWTRFKLGPSLAAAGLEPEAPALEALWLDAARDVLFFWRQAATLMREPGHDPGAPGDAASLVGGGGDLREWRNHLRSWRRLLADMPPARRLAAAAGLGATLLARYPLDVVREEGMLLLDRRLAEGAEPRVRAARGGFPHHGGPWGVASAELTAAWKALVFGRTD